MKNSSLEEIKVLFKKIERKSIQQIVNRKYTNTEDDCNKCKIATMLCCYVLVTIVTLQ